ncbi:hypothetical protein Tco_0039661 [Tanacetum coccineum]
MAEQDTPPPTITAMKIPIIKKGEYDIWSMRMRQYICHTDHNLWDIIVNGDLQEEPAPTGDQSGPSAPPVPKTAKQLAAKRNQERIAKWEESSKSLNILLNNQMSAHDKNGLGYGTQLNEMSNKSETDSEIRNFLTPRADISFAGLDEYVIRKKIIESKTDTSKSKTSETIGNTNEVNVEKPKSINELVVSTPNINKDKFIIEDWNTDDEVDVSEANQRYFYKSCPVVDSGLLYIGLATKLSLRLRSYNEGFEAFGNKLNFKLLDESQVVLRAPRKDDVYSLDLKNIVPSGDAAGISNLPDAEIYDGLATLGSHEAPLHEGHTSGSAEDNLQLKELMVLVPKLVTRIANLEKELHQTKTTYGKAVLTLVERVKSLEVALKRKTKKVVVSDSEDEETENQGRKIQDINDDPLVSWVREFMKEKDTDFVTPTKISASGEVQEQDIGPTILEAAKTLSHVISQKAKSTDKLTGALKIFNTGNKIIILIAIGVSTVKEKQAPMTTEEIQATKRTKAQIQQEEAGLAEAMRLQALQEEEAARQVHLDALLAKRISEEEELSEQQKKRKAEVQEAAQYYTEEDWDTIRTKLKANAELTKSLQEESMTSKDFAKRIVEMINQKRSSNANKKAKARRSKLMTQAKQRD